MGSSLFFGSFLVLFSVLLRKRKNTNSCQVFFLADSLHNIFRSYDKKIVSEIRTIRIFRYFTDKSVAYVQIRPHYYTVFPAFPQ